MQRSLTHAWGRAAAKGLLLAALTLMMALGSLAAKAAGGSFGGGSGAAGDPYIVQDAADLNAVRNNLSASYLLAGDIDLAGYDAGDGGGWLPIGDQTNRFTGLFDGGGHAIKNIAINRTAIQTVGLFGAIGIGGAIQNLGLVGGSIQGDYSVGGLAGTVYSGGAITNCHNTAAITGNNSTGIGYGAGGIAGYNEGTITNCYNTGAISGGDPIGGVVGWNNFSGAISSVYNTGPVTSAAECLGGVAGYGLGSVTNAYNTGAVTGTADYSTVGGVVGCASGAVTNTYNAGTVSATGAHSSVDGVGTSLSSTTSSYFDETVNPALTGAASGATGLTTAQMQQPSSFVIEWTRPSRGVQAPRWHP